MESLKKGVNRGKSQNLSQATAGWQIRTWSQISCSWICTLQRKTWSNRPRSILMKLLRYKDKEEILKREKKNLTGTKIFINEDFTMWDRNKWSCYQNLRKHVSRDRLHTLWSTHCSQLFTNCVNDLIDQITYSYSVCQASNNNNNNNNQLLSHKKSQPSDQSLLWSILSEGLSKRVVPSILFQENISQHFSLFSTLLDYGILSHFILLPLK